MIAVAFSGGIDSLMTLLLLREQGHQIFALHGIFQDQDPVFLQGLQKQCADLQVRLHFADLRQAFRQYVITPFVQDYLAGHTPNPCAWCNRRIKFGLLLQQATALGADKLASGHYALCLPTPDGWGLFQGLDPDKDQSYFLSLLTASSLPRLIFPLGRWHKNDVYQAVAQAGFSAGRPKESQEICFIPDNYKDFLRRETGISPRKGKIIGPDGVVLGEHKGLWHYTLGQRKGLGIAHAFPLYVTGMDMASNTLLVGPKTDLLTTGCQLRKLNELLPFAAWPEKITVRTRYRQKKHAARIEKTGDTARLFFTEPIECPPPGQVATLYDRNGRVLAGAIIANS